VELVPRSENLAERTPHKLPSRRGRVFADTEGSAVTRTAAQQRPSESGFSPDERTGLASHQSL